jgi:hypothetical protein
MTSISTDMITTRVNGPDAIDSGVTSGGPTPLSVIGRADSADLHQFEAQTLELAQHSVQRRLVLERSAEHCFDRQLAHGQVKSLELGGE